MSKSVKSLCNGFSNGSIAMGLGIRSAFIFGSASRLGRFHDASDVDIAVEQIKGDRYFIAISLLSAWLECDVDLIELEKCPFQHRIRETGLAWKAPPT